MLLIVCNIVVTDGTLLVDVHTGGFGRGQIRFANPDEVTNGISNGSITESLGSDGIAILQNYHSFTATYRVWVLGDHIQCCVRVEEGLIDIFQFHVVVL
jgi:hypothetical protein